MAGYGPLQTETTVTGNTAGGDVTVIQPMPEWLDFLNYADIIVTIHTKTVSLAASDTADIALCTTDDKRAGSFDAVPNGPRWDAYTKTGIASDQFYKQLLTLEQATVTGSTKPADRFVCWVLTVHKVASGGDFSVTFEIFVTAKRAA